MSARDNLTDRQRQQLRDLDRASAYAALWVGMLAAVIVLIVVMLHMRGII